MIVLASIFTNSPMAGAPSTPWYHCHPSATLLVNSDCGALVRDVMVPLLGRCVSSHRRLLPGRRDGGGDVDATCTVAGAGA
jgi:hypothetical protein